jgi:hypothetical protein
MARRNGELMDLVAGACLDAAETHLVFFNRKSGPADMREKVARPIPPIATRFIKQIEYLQEELISRGLLKAKSFLFAHPLQSDDRLALPGQSNLYEALDFFCDYFEMPLDQEGRRYYIRQHQLRRFFAMMFFWGSAFGGMDTLRWFLGHTDLAHLYHYITESTPGEVLRAVKAQYASERVRAQGNDTELLRSLLMQHFGTRDFSILDSEELDLHIEELIIEGQVNIEPEFFSTPEGDQMRVLIKTTPILGR